MVILSDMSEHVFLPFSDMSSQDQDGEREEKVNDAESYLREQDRFLPIANVSRIMKKAVPPIGKVGTIIIIVLGLAYLNIL